MSNNIDQLISSIPIWQNNILISKIDGGITNQNFLVEDGIKKFFVRVGKDIPEHLVFRSNEIIASKVASSLQISPKVIFNNDDLQVIDFIKGSTLNEKEIKENLNEVISLIKKVHHEMPKNMYGQSIIFWVFHVIRHYNKFLEENNSEYTSMLSELLKKSDLIEKKSSPFEIVFAHNDLLPANFIKDNEQLWLIDWEYAGYNTPLFDLGGLSSNNNFNEKEDIILLENYYEKKIEDEIINKFKCLKSASLLRETMWSMVSEITSKIDFDYNNYTSENLIKFNQSFEDLDL